MKSKSTLFSCTNSHLLGGGCWYGPFSFTRNVTFSMLNNFWSDFFKKHILNITNDSEKRKILIIQCKTAEISKHSKVHHGVQKRLKQKRKKTKDYSRSIDQLNKFSLKNSSKWSLPNPIHASQRKMTSRIRYVSNEANVKVCLGFQAVT